MMNLFLVAFFDDFFFLFHYLEPTLQQGRKKLIEEKSGERFKLKTPDSNELDVFFIDRRHET